MTKPLKRIIHDYDTVPNVYQCSQCRTLTTQLALAREALEKYGRHRRRCADYIHANSLSERIRFINGSCICGLSAALTTLEDGG